jgi:acetyl esterase/lipase
MPSIREGDQMLRRVAGVFGRSPADKLYFCPIRHWWDKNATNETAVCVEAQTFENMKYGPHMRQSMDVWLAEGKNGRAPCVIEIHGGGWMEGDRLSRWVPGRIRQCRRAGCAYVTTTYRLIPDGRDEGVKPPVKACLDDAVAAIKFVQDHAEAWGIDPARIGLTGGSAGACSSLYASLQGDNALGIRAVCVNHPQTSIDPKEMKEWIPNSNYGAHAFGYPGFPEWLAHRDECLPWIEKFSPAGLLRRCTPARAPKFFLVHHDLPKDGALPADPTHAGMFCVKFAEICAKKGISCERAGFDRMLEALCK